MENQTKIIEVNGVKMEVDMSQVKVVNSYKIGDRVKVLIKKYNGDFERCSGAIIGFDNFKERPTIVVAYLERDYRRAQVKFVYINKENKDAEIVPDNGEGLPLNKGEVEKAMRQAIEEKRIELAEEEHRLIHFQKWFGKYFEDIKSSKEAA